MGNTESFERRLRGHLQGARRTSGLVTSTCIFGGASWHMLARESGLRELALSLGVLWLTYLGSVFAHELGHALVAHAVGFRPIAVISGAGPSLRRRFAGIAWNLGLLPSSGLTQLVSETKQPKMKLRLLATYVAGPAVSLALWTIGHQLWGQHWAAFRTSSDTWLMPGAALVIVNFLLFLSSVIPLRNGGDIGAPNNDIMQAFSLIRMPEARLDALVLAADSTEISQLLALERYSDAFEAVRRHAPAAPDNWLLRLQLGTFLLIAREYGAAVTELEPLHKNAASKDDRMAAIIASNYAWACYMLDDPARLEDAERASAQAERTLPNAASIIGTRGALLVAQGDTKRGKPLLQRALKLHRLRTPKATNLVGLALASLQEGRIKSARKLLKDAEALDSDCELLARGKQELALAEQRRAARKAAVPL